MPTKVQPSSRFRALLQPTIRLQAPTLLVTMLMFISIGVFMLMHGHAQTATLHYTVNTGSNVSPAAAAGFNVFDVAGSTSSPSTISSTVNALPGGSLALIWVGNLDNAPQGSACPAPGFSTAQFQAQVDALNGNSKVFGYYISDEPHPSVCPTAVADIAARADYIHAHTNQKAFIVVLDGSNMCGTNLGCEYQALAPANSHVDLVGLDPYPCHYDSSGNSVPCDISSITTKVQTAISKGIPIGDIVPTFQTFGQENRTDGKQVYYRTPTTSEMTAMIAAWNQIVPSPVMDYSYSFGIQCSPSSCPAPQTLANNPELTAILAAHNAGPVTTNTPPPPPSGTNTNSGTPPVVSGSLSLSGGSQTKGLVKIDGVAVSNNGKLDTSYLTNGDHTLAVTQDGVTSTRTINVDNKLTPWQAGRNIVLAAIRKPLTETNIVATLAVLVIAGAAWVFWHRRSFKVRTNLK